MHIRGVSTVVLAALLLLHASTAMTVSGGAQRNLTAHVDTRIGTGGGGYGFADVAPQVQVPFGCLRLGPDTSLGLDPIFMKFNDMNGYYWGNKYIEAFSHTHLVGAGIGDFQNIAFMPTRSISNDLVQNSKYRSKYDHEKEVALPGYYAVQLETPNVFAEMTVSGTHAGIQKYTYANSGSKSNYLLLDMCRAAPTGIYSPGGKACKHAQILNVTADENETGVLTVEAVVFTAGAFTGRSRKGGTNIWVKARIAAAAANGTVKLVPTSWEEKKLIANVYQKQTTSGSLGAVVEFITKEEGLVVTVHSAISFISRENAAINLNAQAKNKDSNTWMDFTDATQATVDEWESILSRVQVGSASSATGGDLKTFYSSLYRAHQVPSTYSESNGLYLGQDFNVYSVKPGHRHLSDLSIWDIYRSQTPLLAITAPDIARDLAISMMAMHNVTGNLPQWVLANVEADCMTGKHSAVILADYIMKDVGGMPSTADMYDAVVNGIRKQSKMLQGCGYVPFTEHNKQAASHTLDYAVDAGAIYHLAQLLGDNATAQEFLLFASSYRNEWDPNTSYILPRYANGSFVSGVHPYEPYPFSHHYQEGNGAQYRWYVPHDLQGLINLFPNRSFAANELNDLFVMGTKWPKFINTTLPNWGYWAGNEIDLLAPFTFNFIGAEYAHLTQYWVQETLKTYYFPDPAGVPGNDDYGEMSAWVIFSYLGLYPVASTDLYTLFTPIWDEIEVSVPLGDSSPWRHSTPSTATKTVPLHIKAYNRPVSGTAYLANVTVNGHPLAMPVVTQKDLLTFAPDTNGTTTIEFYLTSKPTVFGHPASEHGGPEPHYPTSRLDRLSFDDFVSKRTIDAIRHTSLAELLETRARQMFN